MESTPQKNQLIGRRADTRKIIGKICGRDSGRRVICIWGTAGVGKTALVESIYQSTKIVGFPIRGWTTVMQPFNLKDFLRRLLASQLSSPNKITLDEVIRGRCLQKYLKMEIKDLHREVMRLLEDKKYLIVLDGVSSTNELCLIMDHLPDNEKGSRIIVTSRKEEVAKHSLCTDDPHNLQCLNSMDALKLFKAKVRHNI